MSAIAKLGPLCCSFGIQWHVRREPIWRDSCPAPKEDRGSFRPRLAATAAVVAEEVRWSTRRTPVLRPGQARDICCPSVSLRVPAGLSRSPADFVSLHVCCLLYRVSDSGSGAARYWEEFCESGSKGPHLMN